LAEAQLQTEIDRLYGLPLDEFVSGRDALAKRLRGDGDREGGAAVKALRKPTAGAWALNQAVRRRHAETKALLTAGQRLRSAHAGLLSGGDRDELRAAMAEQRELAATLADCAEAIASETGKSGPALKERVRTTLHAAALDEEVREHLARGRLTREREAVGLGGGFEGSTATPLSVVERRRADDRADDRAKAERLLAKAQTAVKQAESAQEEASARVEAARAELNEAEASKREAAKVLRARQRERAKEERDLHKLPE